MDKKIHFKSTYRSFNDDSDNIIEFFSEVVIENENGYRVLTFDEMRNGKKITNRIEYNENELKIFSGVSSLTCKLKETIKNHFIVQGMESQTFYIYTNMEHMNILDENNISFKYKTSHDGSFEESTTIFLELKIH